jgi:hypothetical protein
MKIKEGKVGREEGIWLNIMRIYENVIMKLLTVYNLIYKIKMLCLPYVCVTGQIYVLMYNCFVFLLSCFFKCIYSFKSHCRKFENIKKFGRK